MSNETARFLRRYQQWRKGEIESFYPDSHSGPKPKEVTAAIDAAIVALESGPAPMSGERMTDAALADWKHADIAQWLEQRAGAMAMKNGGSIDAMMLRKAAAALRARPQAVAECYALVPVEPTEAMLSVAVDNWSGYEEESGRFYTPLDSDVRILWKAMLAASQSATGGAT